MDSALLGWATFYCEQSGLFELDGEEGDPQVLLGQLDVEALVVAGLLAAPHQTRLLGLDDAHVLGHRHLHVRVREVISVINLILDLDEIHSRTPRHP